MLKKDFTVKIFTRVAPFGTFISDGMKSAVTKLPNMETYFHIKSFISLLKKILDRLVARFKGKFYKYCLEGALLS